MSAFMCSDNHLRAIVSKANTLAWKHEIPHGILIGGGDIADLSSAEGRNKLTAELYRANLRSLDARYPHDAKPELYDMPPAYRDSTPLSDAAALKAVECYRYQACEVSDFDSTPMGKFTAEMARALTRRLLDTIPAYVNAQWGLD